jgi:hypothetical protein
MAVLKPPPADADYSPSTRHIYKNLTDDEVESALRIQTDLRKRAWVTDKDVCVGCFLGDASPLTHDYSYGCEWGEGGNTTY